MRLPLLALLLSLVTAAPVVAESRTFLCKDMLGQNPFRLDFIRDDAFEGAYTVTSQAGSTPVMAGSGRHSLLDGGTSIQIVDGPLAEVLAARYIHIASPTDLVLDGTAPWVYYCEKAKL
jgi:hypothetical protein